MHPESAHRQRLLCHSGHQYAIYAVLKSVQLSRISLPQSTHLELIHNFICKTQPPRYHHRYHHLHCAHRFSNYQRGTLLNPLASAPRLQSAGLIYALWSTCLKLVTLECAGANMYFGLDGVGV